MRRVMEYLSRHPHLVDAPVKDIVCISGYKRRFVKNAQAKIRSHRAEDTLLANGLRPVG